MKDVDVSWEVPVVVDSNVQDVGFVWRVWRDAGRFVRSVDSHLGAGCYVVQVG